MKPKISLLELFLSFFKINTVTFGGGYTIVAIIRDEFVLKKELIDEDEMLDLTAMAQSGPGAMTINTSILTGYKLRGLAGAIVCMLASVLPCLIIITLLFYVYDAFRTNYFVNYALMGMSGAVSAILIVTTYNMGKSAIKNHPMFSIIIMIFAFIASFIFHINAAIIILFLAILGVTLFSIIKEENLK